MCGIAGIVGRNRDAALIPGMLSRIKHRGPDYQGFYLADFIHLGHCRLAINDLSERANQPFVDASRNIAVAVNGEIYNFRELRKLLEDKGYRFISESDSEVVLHGYIEFGLELIRKLNGMFAICIWDGEKGEMYLIRDRLGIKPLYYSMADKCLLFSSEIKALALHERVDLTTDLQSFTEYLAFENYFSNRTLNEKIKLIEPGEIVGFRVYDQSLQRKYFWQPAFDYSGSDSEENLLERYISLIESSVNRHLVGDVPLGCYLSSGIDSSSVAYWAGRDHKGQFQTFTGFFGIRGFYDEAAGAAETSRMLGFSNKRVEIRPEDFVNNIEKILWHLDEPRVGMGTFSQFMVAKTAALDVRVILTGHGGDEFFAGYPVYKAIYGKNNFLRLALNSSARELLFSCYFIFYPRFREEARYFLPNIYPLKYLKNLLKKEFHDEVSKIDIFREPEALRRQYADEYERLTSTYIKYYLPALFIVEDKVSMASSLESRTPLCDNELVDFALSIPLSKKLSGYQLKHIPKTAMKGKLPDFLYGYPKRGFPTPLKMWFKNELREYIREFIMDNLCYANMFNSMEVERIISSFQSARIPMPFDEINAHKIWIILNLLIYFRFQKQRYGNGCLN